VKERVLTILIALDCFLFALLTLGNCKRGETISAAAWSLERDGKVLGRVFRPAIDWLFTAIEADHCFVSYVAERRFYSGAL